MQRENLSPKCDKPNMALSQIGDKTKLALVGATILRGEEAMFWVSNCSSKNKEKKKRRTPGLELSYLLVWNSCIGNYVYGILVWKSLLV